MMAKRSTAQRLGRVLERVTRQSGRLPETPAYGSWLLGRVSESQARRRVRIQLILTVFIVGANVIGIGVAALLLTVAFPTPSIFSDAPLWITFGVTPAYCAVALGLGTWSDHPPNHRRLAMGDRGAGAHPGGRARHVHGSVLAGARRPLAVGHRYRIADDAVRVGRQHVHSDRGILRQCLRNPGVYRLLSVHRVRAASGGGPGARGGPGAAAIGARDHGPNVDGVAARVGCSGARHHRHRAVGRRAAGQSEQDPVGGRDPGDLHCRTDFRLRADVDSGLADRDTGAGGARRAQACRRRRSARRSGGVRRHRTRRVAARIQRDGRRAARARAGARPVRPARRARGRRGRRARQAASLAAKSAMSQWFSSTSSVRHSW